MRLVSAAALTLTLAACTAEEVATNAQTPADSATPAAAPSGAQAFTVEPAADFDMPWAMAALPDGRLLVTEKQGGVKLWSPEGAMLDVAGAPKVDFGGQGGMGDIVLHPDFANTRLVYMSWIEAGDGDTRGAVVGRARLAEGDGQARLEALQVIWRQEPKRDGRGHYGHRIAFSPDGQFMFVTTGDRQQFTPSQDMGMTYGKIVRLTVNGGVPGDNPWYDKGRITSQIWTLGHRNPLGLAFAPDGKLWSHEMGPEGGDEFNLIERGSNYGYPIVSNGDHYDGKPIPDHDTRPEFNAPEITWTPVISPAGLIFYTGDDFPAWRGSALMGALSGEALVRVEVNGTTAREAERFPMGARIREVEQGPDGSLWVLEDSLQGSQGRLLRLMPRR